MAANQKICLRQRLFAKFMASEDGRSYEQYGDKKKALFSQVTGRVLEIGPGIGVNLRFLPSGINWIGIEPNPAMHPYLQREADRLEVNIELREGISAGRAVYPVAIFF